MLEAGSDRRRTDEQSSVHAYGYQTDASVMRGGPVARSKSGSNVPVPRVNRETNSPRCRASGGRSSIDCVLVDAIVGKTPIISCDIAGKIKTVWF